MDLSTVAPHSTNTSSLLESKVSSSKTTPTPRPMPQFLQNIFNANKNIICTASGDEVKKVNVASLLSMRLRIPIFQRRYCWDLEQWQTLLADALRIADGFKEVHALGRLTCVRETSSKDGRLSVIDGQQRNTTCSLLLAAIRDILEKRGGNAACQTLASDLDALLLPDKEGFEAWLSSRCSRDVDSEKSTIIAEGEQLEFAALAPTYCDRASYYAAILPSRASAIAASGEWQRPMEAKTYFVNTIQSFSSDRLQALADAVLHKLEWLLFPISVSQGHKDGTEDLNVIYERLAERDATFCKPSRSTEYASMGSADFVRNLLLGSFEKERSAVEMYKRYWLPIEQDAADAARSRRTSGVAALLDGMLDAFLAAQPEQHQQLSARAMHSGIGGHLYARFRRWLVVAIDVTDAKSVDLSGVRELEDHEVKLADLLRRLHDFSKTYFLAEVHESSGAPYPSSEDGVQANTTGQAWRLPPSLLGGVQKIGTISSRWRCLGCKFMNESSATNCSACLMAKR
eukprot:TRINITY_DN28077_c0_g1_i1.p1 TRINITY_DN28077_c0_g1~~TRINITY_DN28077_c0_g1_i1.p1  ORF type:complete len:530 (+),score=46.74 TRINITY_DN28077_c0_g1_i1:50-1591(+)